MKKHHQYLHISAGCVKEDMTRLIKNELYTLMNQFCIFRSPFLFNGLLYRETGKPHIW
ncbi:MAG: hypothetical protein LUG98_02400 [Tannerellaceae bacterium]|nr:hypothetical protein [Tannerellaceae bacterium]